jgi:hypothetical protein
MKSITKEDIKIIFDSILEKLDRENVKEIAIQQDLYRFIPTDEWDSYERNYSIEGSLFDDLDSLKLLIADRSRFCSYVDFDRMASILRYISEKLAPVNN